MKRSVGWGVGAVVIAALIVGVALIRQSGRPSDRPLTIGAVLPLTGGAAFIGQPSKNGMELAVQVINARGGVNGRQVQVIFEDSANEAKKALTSMQKLVSIDKAPVVVTALSAPSFPIAEYLASSGFPCVQVATFVTPTSFPEISPWSFRVYNSADQEAGLLARLVAGKLGLKRAAVYFNNDDYGKDVARAFAAAMEGTGGSIVASEMFDKGQQDHRDALAKLKAASPEAVLFVGNDQSFATSIKQAREAEVAETFVATTGFSVGAYQKTAGTGAEGTYFAAPAFESESASSTPEDAQFRAKYEERYGTPASILCAFPYACVELIAAAASQAGSDDASAIREALLGLRNVKTVVGVVSVSPSGDVKTDLVVKRIREGAPVELRIQ